MVLCACGDNVVAAPVAHHVRRRRRDLHACPASSTTRLRDEDCEPRRLGRWRDVLHAAFLRSRVRRCRLHRCDRPHHLPYVATYLTIGTALGPATLLQPPAPGHAIDPRYRAQYYVPTPSGCTGPTPPSRAAVGRRSATSSTRSRSCASCAPHRKVRVGSRRSRGTRPTASISRSHSTTGARRLRRTAYTDGANAITSCAAPAAAVFEYYADAACTQPLVAAEGDAPPVVALGCETFAERRAASARCRLRRLLRLRRRSTLPDGWQAVRGRSARDRCRCSSRERAGSAAASSRSRSSPTMSASRTSPCTTPRSTSTACRTDADVPRCMPELHEYRHVLQRRPCSQSDPDRERERRQPAERLRSSRPPRRLSPGRRRRRRMPLYVPSTGDRCMRSSRPASRTRRTGAARRDVRSGVVRYCRAG